MFDKILQRLMRMAKFDWTVFDEIQFDEDATQEAAIIVGIAALASAIGSIVGGGFLGFLVQLIVVVAVNWLLWSYITMLVGTKLFEGEATFEQMARTLGYTNAPLVLGILGLIPCLGGLISFLAGIVALVLAFFAVRETQDLSTEKAIATVAIGWVVAIIVNFILGLVVLGSMFIG